MYLLMGKGSAWSIFEVLCDLCGKFNIETEKSEQKVFAQISLSQY